MATAYTYTELKAGEIRILHLQPGLMEGVLQAKLENVILNDPKHRFVALSWTWGPRPKKHENINLDGKPLLVRPSLREALCALRKDGETVHLWIDAICIDQESEKEQDAQIPLMADIYTLATEVYVWLGQAADDSSYVLETLITRREEEYSSERFIVGILEILLRPWWTRTWILQEYVLNKTPPKLFCGHGEGISGDLLLNVWTRIATSGDTARILVAQDREADIQKLGSHYFLSHLRDSRHVARREYLRRNLRNALSWLKTSKVTNPRDKIYGALGLIESSLRALFVRDFGVHTDRSTAEVYHDATIYLLDYEKTSSIFYDFPIGRQSPSDSSLPSWVPNFDLDKALYPISKYVWETSRLITWINLAKRWLSLIETNPRTDAN